MSPEEAFEILHENPPRDLNIVEELEWYREKLKRIDPMLVDDELNDPSYFLRGRIIQDINRATRTHIDNLEKKIRDIQAVAATLTT